MDSLGQDTPRGRRVTLAYARESFRKRMPFVLLVHRRVAPAVQALAEEWCVEQDVSLTDVQPDGTQHLHYRPSGRRLGE